MSSGGKRPSPEPQGPRGARAAAGAALVALPLLLPFEAPLFRLGPLVITSAELGLYLVLAIWGAGLGAKLGAATARGGLRGGLAALGAPDPLARGAALWLAVVVVSALAAPAHRADALKFALRTLGGGLLFFATRDLIRSRAQARRLVSAVVVGAALSALAALLEATLRPSAPLWRLFRPGAFSTLGLQRASGAFAYPTIAAMYWEAALALAVVIPLSGRAGTGGRAATARARGALALALAGLLAGAMLLSATRTALVGATLACAALLVIGWRRDRPVALASGGSLTLIALLVAGTLAGDRSDWRLGQRLRWWHDDSWFAARYQLAERALTLTTGAVATVAITVENTGALTWRHAGRDAVFLSYHWQTSDAGPPRIDLDGRRTPLPQDVPVGATLPLAAEVQAPGEPGRYRLRWDLVCERVTWFSARGSPTADQIVDVVGDATPLPGRRPLRQGTLEGSVTAPLPARADLWRAAVRLWRQHPVLGVGPDNFRRLYPDVLPPARDGRRFKDQRLHANNFYFETLADLGLGGLLALGLVMAAWLRLFRARATEGADMLAVACLVAVGTFFVHGALDYFLEFTPTYGLYWLLLALAGGWWHAPAASPAPPDSRP